MHSWKAAAFDYLCESVHSVLDFISDLDLVTERFGLVFPFFLPFYAKLLFGRITRSI